MTTIHTRQLTTIHTRQLKTSNNTRETNGLIRLAVGTVYSEHLIAISETDMIRMSQLSNRPAVADRGADVGQNNLHLISL